MEDPNEVGTKARSVAKLWYEYLKNKPDLGIKILNEDNKEIYFSNNKTLTLKENVQIVGNKINSDIGGKIEFTIPNSMECEVIGDSPGASSSGKYTSGEKLILGAGQKFNISLIKPTTEIENLNIKIYENYNIIKIDGEKDENDTPLQDIAGLYKTDIPESINIKLDGQIGILNITKKVIDKSSNEPDDYYIGIFKENNELFDIIKFNTSENEEVTKKIYIPLNDNNDTIYFIKETDKEGNILNSDSKMSIEIDNETVIYNNENNEQNVKIINTYIIQSPNTGINDFYYFLIIIPITLIFYLILNSKYKKFQKI